MLERSDDDLRMIGRGLFGQIRREEAEQDAIERERPESAEIGKIRRTSRSLMLGQDIALDAGLSALTSDPGDGSVSIIASLFE